MMGNYEEVLSPIDLEKVIDGLLLIEEYYGIDLIDEDAEYLGNIMQIEFGMVIPTSVIIDLVNGELANDLPF